MIIKVHFAPSRKTPHSNLPVSWSLGTLCSMYLPLWCSQEVGTGVTPVSDEAMGICLLSMNCYEAFGGSLGQRP